MQPSRKPTKSQLPDWRNKLKAILKVLDKMTGTKLTVEQLQKLGIQLFDLDFVTGKTSHSTISYFMPSQQDIDIANSGIDAAEDDFAKSCRSRHRKVHGDHGWPESLHNAFSGYLYALSYKHSSEWENVYAYYS